LSVNNEKYMLKDMIIQLIITPGSVLIIIYLLPSLSIKNMAINDPSALVKANGILSITPYTL
jgi:hypothetical protein